MTCGCVPTPTSLAPQGYAVAQTRRMMQVQAGLQLFVRKDGVAEVRLRLTTVPPWARGHAESEINKMVAIGMRVIRESDSPNPGARKRVHGDI